MDLCPHTGKYSGEQRFVAAFDVHRNSGLNNSIALFYNIFSSFNTATFRGWEIVPINLFAPSMGNLVSASSVITYLILILEISPDITLKVVSYPPVITC